MSTSIDNLAAEIAAGLSQYNQEVSDGIKKLVDTVSAEGVKELKSVSPKRSGKYEIGWRAKKMYEDTRSKRKNVYNKTSYQITHLLENGHVNRDGSRTRAIVHIKPVEEEMIQKFEQQVKEVIQNAT